VPKREVAVAQVMPYLPLRRMVAGEVCSCLKRGRAGGLWSEGKGCSCFMCVMDLRGVCSFLILTDFVGVSLSDRLRSVGDGFFGVVL
jgi:hypothetical protein